MDNPNVSRRHRFLLIVVIAPCLCLSEWARGDEPAFVPPDCGLNSLFLLLELSGNRADLALLRRSLPPQTPEGYSLLDLKNSAAAIGYRCRGVAIEKEGALPDRAAIAFMGGRTNGHFIVIRPIGGSGTARVQVLDPPYPPALVDYAKLVSDPHWTGKLLICESTGELIYPYIVPISAVLLILMPPALRSLRGRMFGRRRYTGQ